VKVHWTSTALNHLRAIHEYAAQNSKIYADRLIDSLTQKSEQIGLLPRSGRIVPEYTRDDIREVIERPYRIIYRVKEDQIDVLAVVHGARRMPPEAPA